MNSSGMFDIFPLKVASLKAIQRHEGHRGVDYNPHNHFLMLIKKKETVTENTK